MTESLPVTALRQFEGLDCVEFINWFNSLPTGTLRLRTRRVALAGFNLSYPFPYQIHDSRSSHSITSPAPS